MRPNKVSKIQSRILESFKMIHSSQATTANQSRHVLFWSKHCEYSRTICDAIDANGLSDVFYGVCVDGNLSDVPGFVECVPTILTMDRQVLIDDRVQAFLTDLIQKKRERCEHEDELRGFSLDHARGLTDGFATLDAYDGPDDHHLSFEFLGSSSTGGGIEHHSQKSMPVSEPQQQQQSRPQRMDAKDVEAYMMNRDRDTELAKRSQATHSQQQHREVVA